MRMLTKLSLPALILGMCGAAVASDWHAAGNGDFAAREQLLIAQNGCASLNDAVDRVRRQYNGRIVSAETRVSGKREMHYIKVLTDDGKVKTVTIPGCALRS
jgi:hypothetical protein